MIDEKTIFPKPSNDKENIIPLADKKTLEELSKSILKCIKENDDTSKHFESMATYDKIHLTTFLVVLHLALNTHLTIFANVIL